MVYDRQGSEHRPRALRALRTRSTSGDAQNKLRWRNGRPTPRIRSWGRSIRDKDNRAAEQAPFARVLLQRRWEDQPLDSGLRKHTRGPHLQNFTVTLKKLLHHDDPQPENFPQSVHFLLDKRLEIPQKNGHFLEFYFAFLATPAFPAFPGVAMARQRLQISDF